MSDASSGCLRNPRQIKSQGMLLREAQPPLTINPVHITNRPVMEITQNCVKARTFGTTSADKTLRQIQRFHVKPFFLFYLHDSHQCTSPATKSGQGLAKVPVSGGTIWRHIS